MDGYRQQKRLLLAQGQEMQRMAEQLADEQVKENLHTLIHTLESEQFFVTVVGEFSRGKSTLMNALLGENILPTAIRPTTAVLTFIHHEDGKTARIHDRQGRCREIPWDRKVFKEFTALRDVDAGEIRCMELGVPLADIPEDIILVDTPGVNDVSEQRMDVTYEYIPVSDAVIFVLSAKQPLTQSEWQFLQDFVAESAIRHFFFVLNFKDAVDARELSEAAADVRRRLSHLMPEEEIRIFPISAKEALAAKEDGDAPRLDASGYTAWFQAFRTFLQGDARHEKKLARYREHLGGLRQMLLEHVSLREQEAQLDRAERIAVGEGLQTEKELAERRFGEIRVRLEKLPAQWAQEVQRLIQDAGEDFIQEHRIMINAAEREKDIVRYAEEVLPLALQRHWKQWLEYRQEKLLHRVNGDLQALAQEYCDAFSERQIFFDLCKRAQVTPPRPQSVQIDGKEQIERVQLIGQVGTAAVIGGMAFVSGFALAAIPLVAFGGNNLGSFVTQKFYVDEKLREQRDYLKEQLPRLLEDTAQMIEQALLQEFRQSADKLSATLRRDFDLMWFAMEQRIREDRASLQRADAAYQTDLRALADCRSNLLLLGE